MVPIATDLTIYQGDSFDDPWQLQDASGAAFNLTGLTGKAQIRPTAASSTVLAEFVVTLMNQVSVPGGFTLSLTPAQTAALSPGTAVWDVQFSNAGGTVIETYMAGAVTVVEQVTRP